MSNVRGSYFSRLVGSLHLSFVIFACLLIASCQTMAQRQAISIRENTLEANQKARACVHAIEVNPSYQSIAQHIPLNGNVEPTLAQLADKGVPSKKDIQIIIAVHNDLSVCRERAIEDYMKATPSIIPTLVQAFHASDLVTVDLIQRKITWGKANKKLLALKDKFRAKLQDAFNQIDRNLTASHRAELEQRQRAIDALSQWSYQQQVLMQNQQLINTLNRPVTTNCTAYGNSVHCSSY